jgi:hypothetical protein
LVNLISVNGGWSNWTLAHNCSLVNNNWSIKYTRNCSNPEPKFGGLTCLDQESIL